MLKSTLDISVFFLIDVQGGLFWNGSDCTAIGS